MRRCKRERVSLLRSPCGAVWHLTATKSSYFHSLSCGDFVASHSHHSHQTSAHSTYCLAFSCANFGVKHFKIFMIPPKVSVYIWIAYALRKWKCCKFFLFTRNNSYTLSFLSVSPFSFCKCYWLVSLCFCGRCSLARSIADSFSYQFHCQLNTFYGANLP